MTATAASAAGTAATVARPAAEKPPVLRVRDLAKHFPVRKGVLAREVARADAREEGSGAEAGESAKGWTP